ncbi:hepatic lectin-like [Narcine bancroftii]|uniref:hepatic lectin-like n=1 Tax=Narcine bancroftii TaxID=1343680 RepID=UPI0038317561
MDRKDNYSISKLGIQLQESARGNFFPVVIYTLLGLSILLSVVILGTAICLSSGNSAEISTSLTQLQANVKQLAHNLSHGRPFNQWRSFNHKLYYFSTIKNYWNESLNFCASMNSHLVVINSAAEEEFIKQNIKCAHWIGLHDTVEEGKWLWVDGTDYASNVKFWANGQPLTITFLGQDCVLVDESGLWYDWYCRYPYYAICEKPAV